MSTYLRDIPGQYKFLAIIDNQNTPILFFNLCNELYEFDFEASVFASLDLCEKNKLKEEDPNENNRKDDYKGLLIPLYDFEEDLGAYGYIGSNGIKIIVIKNLDNKQKEDKLESLCRDIYLKFIELTLNPFYNKNEFSKKDSSQKNKFIESIFQMLVENQIA